MKKKDQCGDPGDYAVVIRSAGGAECWRFFCWKHAPLHAIKTPKQIGGALMDSPKGGPNACGMYYYWAGY
jgi:hypothetical protein